MNSSPYLISERCLMHVFSSKSKKPQSTNECHFVWKKVNTEFGTFFKERNVEIRSKRKTSDIGRKELLQVLHLSQRHAAKSLNCSLSTLKRRFYELKHDFGLTIWPQSFREISHLPIFRQIYPMSLDFILNPIITTLPQM